MAFKFLLAHLQVTFLLYSYFCGSTSTIIKMMQFLKTCIDLPFVVIPWAVTQGQVSRHQKYLPFLTDCQYEKKERRQAKQIQRNLAFLNLRKSCSGGGQNRSHQPTTKIRWSMWRRSPRFQINNELWAMRQNKQSFKTNIRWKI